MAVNLVNFPERESVKMEDEYQLLWHRDPRSVEIVKGHLETGT